MSEVILLIDDDTAHRRLFKRLLKKAGVQTPVVEGSSVAEGRALLKQIGTPALPQLQLAIFDMNLGDGRGTDLIREARKCISRELPILVVSTSALETDIEEAISAGASAYLTKCADPEEFLDQLEPILEQLAIQVIHSPT